MIMAEILLHYLPFKPIKETFILQQKGNSLTILSIKFHEILQVSQK